MGRLITIVEVSPRDGIQNESTILSVATRLELVRKLAAAGLEQIEVASFVNPKRVPQMADAEAVISGLPVGIRAIGLALNLRGVERALATSIDSINFGIAASDEFSQRNQGAPVDPMLAQWAAAAALCRDAGRPLSVVISTAFGCPYAGEISPQRVCDMIGQLAEAGPASIALADTIGAAAPSDVRKLIEMARATAPGVPLTCHFHNTRNTGMANAVAAVEAGVTTLESSLGGFGGCPFAPNATGNTPTEDLVYMLHRMGYETGVDLNKLVDAAIWLGERIGRAPPGMLSHAGVFPRRVA